MKQVWLFLQIMLFAIDCWIFLSFSDWPGIIFAGHLIISICYAFTFGKSLDARYPFQGAVLLGAILSLFLPIAGIACTFIIAMLLLFKPLPQGDLLEEFKEHTTLPDIEALIHRPIEAEGPHLRTCQSVEPLVDMLASADAPTKRAILDAIAKRKIAKLIPHIIAALEDPKPDVYQFAIAKISQLQHDYGAGVAHATEAVQAEPENIAAHQRLAKVYDQYLKSGLVDQSITDFYYQQLEKTYQKILFLSPDDIITLKKLGQLSIETGQIEAAKEAFSTALQLRPNDIETQFGLIKVLYQADNFRVMFDQIRQVREALLSVDNANQELVNLTDWWLTPETHTSGGEA